MSLVKVNEILQHAWKHKYGVAAINTLNYETIKCAVAAAEAERVPVILQFFPGLDKYIPLKYIADMAVDMARKASVPVAVHLDHSASYEIALGGIRDGFPSVMVDGSVLPFEENVAVGNAHGDYIQEPNLDFDRIAKIRQAVSVPLVLHGCSGIPDWQMQRAVNLGMSKFNIATEYFAAMYRSLDEVIQATEHKADGIRLMLGAAKGMTEFVVNKIRLLNPNKYTM